MWYMYSIPNDTGDWTTRNTSIHSKTTWREAKISSVQFVVHQNSSNVDCGKQLEWAEFEGNWNVELALTEPSGSLWKSILRCLKHREKDKDATSGVGWHLEVFKKKK